MGGVREGGVLFSMHFSQSKNACLLNLGYFQVRYASRVIIYERKMFKRLAAGIKKLQNLAHSMRR